MSFKSYYDYDVYEDGRIWSNKSSKFLTQSIRNNYMRVTLMINKKRITYSVHRLMGEVFLPNFNNLPTVEHKDQNKLNNSLFNLKWENLSNQSHNRGSMRNNKSGVKGVSYHKRKGKWMGYMMLNGKNALKRFDTKEEAILYRRELEVLSGLSYF